MSVLSEKSESSAMLKTESIEDRHVAVLPFASDIYTPSSRTNHQKLVKMFKVLRDNEHTKAGLRRWVAKQIKCLSNENLLK